MKNFSFWVLTDGKAGDEQQCLGVAQALGDNYSVKRISPRNPWKMFMPFGPIDPHESSDVQDSPVHPPFPDCVIASGRRAVPYLRHLKRKSRKRIFTVFLKDPRTGSKAADLIWAPLHDRITGDNVIKTLTPPHRISQERIRKARFDPDSRILKTAFPKVTVLVGGNSKHHRFTPENMDCFIQKLEVLALSGCYLMITTSRRTPLVLHQALENLAQKYSAFLWDGEGDNPYVSLLALAESIVVTTDSYNLVGEATASGVPLLLFKPDGGHPKFEADILKLKQLGIAHDFHGELIGDAYEPLDSTPLIAEKIRIALEQHRMKIGA